MSYPGQPTATFFTMRYRAKHIFNRYIHLPHLLGFNDTTLVSFVKKKISNLVKNVRLEKFAVFACYEQR